MRASFIPELRRRRRQATSRWWRSASWYKSVTGTTVVCRYYLVISAESHLELLVRRGLVGQEVICQRDLHEEVLSVHLQLGGRYFRE